MKVATRITVATAVVVAIAAAAYALVDLRGRATERRAIVEREAKDIASALRVALETPGSAFRAQSNAQLTTTGGWRIYVVPRARHAELPSADLSAGQLKRLRTLLEVPHLVFSDIEESQYHYAIALLALSSRIEERSVLGMLEVSRSADFLETPSSDISRARAGPADRARDHHHGRCAREPVRQPADHEAPARYRRCREG